MPRLLPTHALAALLALTFATPAAAEFTTVRTVTVDGWRITQLRDTASAGTPLWCAMVSPAVAGLTISYRTGGTEVAGRFPELIALSNNAWQLGPDSAGTATVQAGDVALSLQFRRTAANELQAPLPEGNTSIRWLDAFWTSGTITVRLPDGATTIPPLTAAAVAASEFCADALRAAAAAGAAPRDPFAVAAPAAPPSAPAPRPGAAAMPVRTSLPTSAAPVQDCDRLAQPKREQMGAVPAPVPGVFIAEPNAAYRACAAAMRQYPNEPRFVAYAALAAGMMNNLNEGFRLAQLAAERGNPVGQHLLGDYHLNGWLPARRDEAEAVRLYRLSAAQGYGQAFLSLAELVETGRAGLAPDVPEALRLYRVAASYGSYAAQSKVDILAARLERGGAPR